MVKDLTNMRFGRLVVCDRAEDNISNSGYRTVMWNCVCDCGNHTTVRAKCLNSGVTKSCGCLARELVSKRASIHHDTGTRLYAIWNSMRQRCNNPNHSSYYNYGGRGIRICPERDDYSVFREWSYRNGYNKNAKRGECTLDRIDVNGGYDPQNCGWIDMKHQCNNKRDTLYYSLGMDCHSLKEWSDITGIKYCTLWRRYKAGWSAERALKH